MGLLLGCVPSSFTQNHCSSKQFPEKPFWPDDLELACHEKIQSQVQMELQASLTYLMMSAHFSHYESHRPGIAKYFLENSLEERTHAKKLIQYLQMRGGNVAAASVSSLVPERFNLSTVEGSLEMAIQMEKSVTTSIKKIIGVCGAEPQMQHGMSAHTESETVAKSFKMESKAAPKQSQNDYHAVDFFTGEFLTEQYEGLKKAVQHLTNLRRMRNFGNFAEIIFDKTLL